MRDPEPLDPWRLEELVNELRAELHADYLNRNELEVAFVPRREHEARARARREWPLIFCAIASGSAAIASVLVPILGGR